MAKYGQKEISNSTPTTGSTNVADEVYDGLRKRLERVLRNLREESSVDFFGGPFSSTRPQSNDHSQTTTVKRPQSNDHSQTTTVDAACVRVIF